MLKKKRTHSRDGNRAVSGILSYWALVLVACFGIGAVGPWAYEAMVGTTGERAEPFTELFLDDALTAPAVDGRQADERSVIGFGVVSHENERVRYRVQIECVGPGELRRVCGHGGVLALEPSESTSRRVRLAWGGGPAPSRVEVVLVKSDRANNGLLRVTRDYEPQVE